VVAAALIQPSFAAAESPLPTAKPESQGISSVRLARLGAGMNSLVEQGRLAGVVTLVARHGRIVEWEAAGKRDIAANRPMQRDSIFRIYSMSKPITGVAMMLLFEEGKWQLNDPVAKYVPEFAGLKVYATDEHGNVVMQEQAHPMTMRELMSHTAGFTYGFLSHTPVDKLLLDAGVLSMNQTMDEFIQRVAKVPLNAQPGSEWHYSISVDIQGYIVQKLSGMPFEQFLRQRIFEPLKMVDTDFYVPAGKLDRLAEFYDYGPEGGLRVYKGFLNHDFSVPPRFASGGGGLVSTAADYLRFCQMLSNGGILDGVRILAPRSVELMRSNVLPSSMAPVDPGIGFGLDFAVDTDVIAAGGYYGKGTYFWSGAAGTWFWIDPVSDLIVIGMIQQVPGENGKPIPDMRGLSHAWVYQALLD
jgi:CubicO group peptidase (beta-lactamase class C family)